MSLVPDLIGNELADALTPHQYDLLRAAAEEAPEGLRRVADEIRSAGSNIDKPVAVLINRVNRNQHHDRQRTAGPKTTSPHDPRDWARRLYAAKLADLHQHATDWTEAEKREHAIDYALDHCRANGTHLLLTIETELRQEHGVQLTGTERDFERDTPHRRLMAKTHAAEQPPDELDAPLPGEPVQVNP